ncbi:MAG: family 16 glycosylhydrolase [Sphingobacteriales bacterium]|nr:family 16 glycosylhydrolase [Sphingobacteriales bacterium]
MKKFIQFILLLMISILSLFTNYSYAQNWQLVWQDDFNTISNDWTFETGGTGWGNNELQYYRQENASIVNGNLVITAKKEDFGGKNYTSARMKTQGKKFWKYGKIEIRAATPAVQGIWPAFWLLGENITNTSWPACGEIDILEHINTDSKNYGTMHWANAEGNYVSYGGNIDVAGLTNFHTFSVEWTSTAIKWFIDGVKYHEASIANNINSTDEFHENFFLILNVAVGGNWPGNNIDNNSLPSTLVVDYIKVYQDLPIQTQSPYGGTAATIPGKIEAENYDNGGEGIAYHDKDEINNGLVYRTTESVDVQPCTDAGNGYNVGWAVASEWLEYTINVTTSASYILEARVATESAGKTFHLELDSTNISGTITVPNTGGWQSWQTVSVITPTLTAGQKILKIIFDSNDFNLNYLNFNLNTCSDGTYTWTGAVSTAWETAGNWSCGIVPDSTTNVIVNSGAIIINSNVSIKSLRLNPAAQLKVNPGNKLTILH